MKSVVQQSQSPLPYELRRTLSPPDGIGKRPNLQDLNLDAQARFSTIVAVYPTNSSFFKRLLFVRDLMDSQYNNKPLFPDLRLHSRYVAKLSALIFVCCFSYNSSPKDFSAGFSETITKGFLHDVGKLSLSQSLLDAEKIRSELSATELRALRIGHITFGSRLLSYFGNPFSRFQDDIAAHHERWDGDTHHERYPAYPNGLKGEAIPFFGRLLRIADVLSVLLHRRSYDQVSVSSSPCPKILVPVLECGAGKEFDPQLAQVAIELLQDARTLECNLDRFLITHPIYSALDLHSIVLFD